MAPPAGTLRVGRYLTSLVLIFGVLYALVAFGSRHAPKLGIDLAGGVRVIFTALSPKGAPPPTSSQMSLARQILEDRINVTGVTGATVAIQGGDQLVVEIPSGTGTDVAKLGKAAILNFRGVIAPAQAVSCGQPVPKTSGSPSASSSVSPSATPSATGSSAAPRASASSSASVKPNDAGHRPLALAPSTSTKASTPAKTTASPAASATPAATASGSSATGSATGTVTGSATGTVTGSATPTAAPTSQPCVKDPIATILKVDKTLKMPTTEAAYTALTATQKQEIAGALANYDCSAAQSELDDPKSYYLACDDGKTYGFKVAYLLGTVIVPGRHIDTASAQAPSTGGTGGSINWTVALTLDGTGTDSWSAWTTKYHTSDTTVSPVQTSQTTAPCGTATATPCSDFVGFTLDGQVISAPVTTAALGRQTQISGNYDQSSANALAQELNYGKLPLSFRADSNEQVSATLGSSQLNAAFLAGGIGLILVVIYSLAYYRGLGLVTIASLLVSAGLTYAMLVILGTQIGFTLDLAGIAGFIVALGITADSFVVFFERIKDEVHGGRSVRVAVPRAWVRARRTILSADTVSFLAAAILYYFASADVKGFAFTLGLSTILDLVVVFLFTHPVVSLLSRSRTFGSPRFTGLNHVRVGGFVLDDDERPKARRGPADRTAGRPKGTAAVLEDEPLTAQDEVDEPVDLEDTSDPVAPDGDPADDSPRRRRHTSPEPGSAAERAAARRARLRGKTDEEGTS